MKAQHSIRTLCRALAVSASGYYAWLQRQSAPAPRTRQNQQLSVLIQEQFKASRQTYGSPRICQALRRSGHVYGRNWACFDLMDTEKAAGS